MPPWEGFDELYHYGIVQHLATARQFPEIGKTTLSRELWNSLDYLPVSHYIQPYLERPSMSFEEYFRLTPEQRSALRRGADTMDRAWRYEGSPRIDYEAKQAPLTYVLFAPVEAALGSASLPTRVFAERALLSLLSIALLWTGTRRLAASLGLASPGLEGPLEAACLLVVFSCQMLYAGTCRVGNDALAAPWLVWFLFAVIESFRRPGWKQTARAAILMAAGLLIKSSLLVFLPLAFAAPAALFLRGTRRLGDAVLTAGIIGGLAGPWYLRNLVLYRNLTATDETSGMGLSGIFRAAAALPWTRSIAEMAHGALWTGNNSFTTFSHVTLDAVLALLAVALLLYAVRARANFEESITIAAVFLYVAILLLITLAFFHSSAGQVTGAMPWYAQVLLAPIVAIAFTGLRRSKLAGKWIGAATVLLWTYVAAASWLAKLVPLYGGFTDPHARPSQLLNWYLHAAAQRDSVLANLCPAPLPMIYLLLAIVIGTLAVASLRVLLALLRLAEVQASCKAPPALLS
jgi:hypothetical protein